MHDPVGPALLVWLETTALAAAMREWLWLYPAVEIVHLAGIVLLVGRWRCSTCACSGMARGLDVNALARFLLPWSWTGLAVVVPSGLLMFSAHATEMMENPAFQLKLALIATAGLNAGWLHRGALREAAAWAHGATPRRARVAAGASLAAVGGRDHLRAAAGLPVNRYDHTPGRGEKLSSTRR
jgi:hypothetical protein